jgi:long-chain acyl-CoA synthetase
VATGALGEIVIRGPNVMLGYWNQPDETSRAIRGGWFRSGDVGRLDAGGYLYVVDRLKEMINVSGFKVYPSEIEQALCRHPAVAEAAVYGVPDSIRGEQVRAAIVLNGPSASAENLEAYCRANVAAYKVPAIFEFRDSLPRNATGKLLKRVLVAEALAK